MNEAATRMKEELAKMDFQEPGSGLLNFTGQRYEGNPADLLMNQINHPVRWENHHPQHGRQGIDCFVEAGPGKTLSGFVSRIAPDAGFYRWIL